MAHGSYSGAARGKAIQSSYYACLKNRDRGTLMAQRLKIIFAGTPAFAAAALTAIHAEGFEVPLVLTQPDRPAGRGMIYMASPVKQYALEAGLALIKPPSLRTGGQCAEHALAAIERLRATPHDVMVVAAYGLLLPQTVLNLAPHGGINIHVSLLPRWRGAAPVQRAIAAGDTETGISLMQMDAGLDTGPVLCRTAIPIHATDTAATLTQTLTVLGAQQIVNALKRFRKTAFCQKYCSPLKAGAMRLKSVKKKRRLIGAVQRIRLPVKSALLTLCLAYIHCGPICQSNYGRRSRRPFIRALRALEKSLKSSRMALPSPAAQTHCA